MITLKKYGMFLVSTIIATSGAFWYARNGADVKAVDIAGLIDVATRHDLKERTDSYISAYLASTTTSVLRADIAFSSIDKIDDFVDQFESATGKYKSDYIACGTINDGFDFAEILVEPEAQRATSGLTNEVTYFYGDNKKYSTNGIPVGTSLWTLDTIKADGTLRVRPGLATNQSPFVADVLGIEKCATSNGYARVNAVWPTNDVDAIGFWPYEDGWSIMDAPLRIEKVVAYGITTAYTNDFMTPLNAPIMLEFSEITNRIVVVTNSIGSAYTNVFLAPPASEQRYALYNVGSKGVAESSWLNHYGSIGLVSAVDITPTSSLMYASSYARNVMTGEVASVTFSTLVPINSGAKMQVETVAGSFAPVSFTGGINTNIADGSFNHTVTFVGLNSGAFYNTQLYRLRLTGTTNSYNPVIISVSSIPSSPPTLGVVFDEASKVFRDGVYVDVGLNYDRFTPSISNMTRTVRNPQVKRSNLDAFKFIIDTNSASIHFLDYGSGWNVKSQNLHWVQYSGVYTQAFGVKFAYNATLDGIFNGRDDSRVDYNTGAGATLYTYKPFQSMIYAKSLTNISPTVYGELSTASSRADEIREEKTVEISWPSVWAITNGLVKRVRAYAICDQNISGLWNPAFSTNLINATYDIGGSTASNDDELFDVAEYYINKCDYVINGDVSKSNFPLGNPVTTSMGTLVYDNASIDTSSTNLLTFTLPLPTSTTLAVPETTWQEIIYNSATNIGSVKESRDAGSAFTATLVIRKLAVVVDWNPILWPVNDEE